MNPQNMKYSNMSANVVNNTEIIIEEPVMIIAATATFNLSQ